MAISRAQDFFNGLTAAAIRRMLGAEQENHTLEFKVIGSDLTQRDDKRNLAVALSGFANSDGGVIVWGVEARRVAKDQSVDQVVALPGVDRPRQLLARLNDLTAQACLPVPVGVEHRIVPSRVGSHFLATFVPASDSGPHMAKLGEDRYYVRSGGSFLRMEHFQVADMFGRRPSPVLEVSILKVEPYSFRLRVANHGRGAARAPFLLFHPPAPFSRNTYGVDGNQNEVLPWVRNHSADGVLHAGGTDFVIHPTMHVDIGGVWLGFQPSPQMLEMASGAQQMRYRAGALGVPPIEGVLRINAG